MRFWNEPHQPQDCLRLGKRSTAEKPHDYGSSYTVRAFMQRISRRLYGWDTPTFLLRRRRERRSNSSPTSSTLRGLRIDDVAHSAPSSSALNQSLPFRSMSRCAGLSLCIGLLLHFGQPWRAVQVCLFNNFNLALVDRQTAWS